jgi:CHAD domain-containing protein
VVATLPATPSDVPRHQIRLLAKRRRYASEAVAPLVGPAAAAFAATVADVQTVLGNHHDAVVAEAYVR